MTTQTLETPARERLPEVTAVVADSARSWFWLGIALFVAVVVYAPLFPRLVTEWSEFSNQSHGFAIPFMSAYLLWARRAQIREAALTPSLLGLPLLVLGLGALVLGMRGHESFIARVSFPVTLLGLTLFLGGRQLFARTWMAIAYLTFMIPLPWTTMRLVTYKSRILDAWASAEAARWLGVPVYREGFMLHLPNMRLEVADVCSSIPAIAALLALGTAYAIVRPGSLAAKLFLIAVTLPLAVLSNIIRIATTVAGVYYLGPWTLRTAYHMFNGTVNFVLTLLLLVALDGLILRFGRARR